MNPTTQDLHTIPPINHFRVFVPDVDRFITRNSFHQYTHAAVVITRLIKPIPAWKDRPEIPVGRVFAEATFHKTMTAAMKAAKANAARLRTFDNQEVINVYVTPVEVGVKP